MTLSETPAPAEDSGAVYSTAFDRMTQGNPKDILGLVAYALYKRMIRDEVLEGVRSSGKIKNPSDTTVEFFRDAAFQELQNFAANAIDEATPELQNSAYLERVEIMGANLERHISNSTSAGRAIWTNMAGWVITIGFTILAILILRFPDLNSAIDAILPKVETSPPAQLEQQ